MKPFFRPIRALAVGLALFSFSAQAGLFETDFESGIPEGTRVSGSANHDTVGGFGNNGGVMKLTRAENTAETGAWVIDDFDGVPIGSFTASFKVLIGSANATPAFGMSFCFAQDLPDNFGVDGAGSGLRIVFDTFDRGGGTAPAIDVYWNNVRLATRRVPVSILRTGTSYVDCVIAIQRDGTLDLTYAGQTIYSNFFCYNPINGNFGFGASTGGIADNHWVDNVKIETTPLNWPYVQSVLPGPSGARPDASVVVELIDYLFEVNNSSIQVAVNGATIPHTLTENANLTTIRADVPTVLAAGSQNTVRVNYSDNNSPPGQHTLEYNFTVANYPTVPASGTVESGVVNQNTSGFKVKVRQADATLANTLERAERQLEDELIDPGTGQAYPNVADTTNQEADGTFTEEEVINYDDQPHFTGFFDGDKPVPGIPGTSGSLDNFAVQITAYLDLPVGVHTFGVRSDDGCRLTIGNSPFDYFALELGSLPTTGGTFERVFYISQAGIYPVRLVWWDATGDGYCEFYSVSKAGERTLINDRSKAGHIKAYREASATRPYVVSVNPRPGQIGVPASTTINAVLKDGSLQVVPGSVKLFVNNIEVSATVDKPANSPTTTITYDPPGQLASLGTYDVRLVYQDNANPAHEGTATWNFKVAESLTPDPPRVQDGNGLLVLEAEHADQNVPAGGTSWVQQTDNPNYSGGAAMAALPNSGRNVNIDTSAAPHLDFKVMFVKTGTHYIWVRGVGDSPPGPSANDSVNVGLDGTLPATSDRIGNGWVAENGVVWANTTFEDPPARFDVPTAGEHVINLWMREDGFVVDKILVTTDANYIPEGAGPPESPRLEIPKPYLQDSGPDHLLVIEAENFDRNKPAGGSEWILFTRTSGFSGSGAMEASPNSGRNVNIDTSQSPSLDYNVYFVATGTHYIWVRGLGDSPPGPSANDSVNVGLDSTLPATSDRIGNGWVAENGFVWANATFEDPPARFDVPTAGEHQLNLWMREDGFVFDKILLTTNPNYVPEGEGPPQSPRELPTSTERPLITVKRVAGGVEISWTPNVGTLQSATTVNGNYANVSNSSNPFQVVPNQGAAFYRVAR